MEKINKTGLAAAARATRRYCRPDGDGNTVQITYNPETGFGWHEHIPGDWTVFDDGTVTISVVQIPTTQKQILEFLDLFIDRQMS